MWTHESCCELDSHADTCVCGNNFLFESDYSRTVNVEPYSPELGKLANIPIGTTCTCWTDSTYCPSMNACILDKILQFSPKLSLKLEYMVRRILIRKNEENGVILSELEEIRTI
jgi:hypothetical protein